MQPTAVLLSSGQERTIAILAAQTVLIMNKTWILQLQLSSIYGSALICPVTTTYHRDTRLTTIYRWKPSSKKQTFFSGNGRLYTLLNSLGENKPSRILCVFHFLFREFPCYFEL